MQPSGPEPPPPDGTDPTDSHVPEPERPAESSPPRVDDIPDPADRPAAPATEAAPEPEAAATEPAVEAPDLQAEPEPPKGASPCKERRPKSSVPEIVQAFLIAVALVGIVVAYVSFRKTYDQSQTFAGGQTCINYREELVKLDAKHLGASQIANLYALEEGVGPKRHHDYKDDKFSRPVLLKTNPYGCGSIQEVLDILHGKK